MICFVALVVFGILAIFSASHRSYAKEAFNCVFRRITLRKCTTNFDQQMKAKITTRLLALNPGVAGFVFKHFELLSWLLTIIFVVSFIYSAYGLYNLYVYGSCDPQHPEQCVFNPQNAKPICNCEFSLDRCTVEHFSRCGTDCNCLSKICGPEAVSAPECGTV